MSLLIFSSANKIAQGIIKRLYASNQFERIICADLYPTYSSVQRFLYFREELDEINSSTTLIERKIEEKSDLIKAISEASHLVYITHDYYTLVPSKLNLIKTTAQLAKNAKLEKFIALTPIEHDHYNEQNSLVKTDISIDEAKAAYPNLVHLKSDITFGQHSSFADILIRRIVNGQPIHFKPENPNALSSPIFSDDIATIVESCLKDSSIQEKSYLLQGSKQYTIGDMISTLQRHTSREAKINESIIEKVLPPTHVNFISERLYEPEYINFAQFIKQYKPLDQSGFENLDSFGITFKAMEEIYLPNKATMNISRNPSSITEKIITKVLD
jgi:hypothetical protein